jgi:sulfatase maturation enzyme AslB (radical SAM superfamily)
VERISIELGNRCDKACWFCYAGSEPTGETRWTVATALQFVGDCAANGVRAVSFGGGEPLQWPGLFELLRATSAIPVGDGRVRLFRSLTTNGLLLDTHFDELVAARPDKVHVSIHFTEHPEVERVIAAVTRLAAAGVRSGVNLLIRRSKLEAAAATVARLASAGIGRDRVVFLPMRGMDTPTAADVARVAGTAPGEPFQSMSCLAACAISPRFCAVSWDWTVGWCSYTRERRPLTAPTFAALKVALGDLGLRYCGGSVADPAPKLIGLRRADSRIEADPC